MTVVAVVDQDRPDFTFKKLDRLRVKPAVSAARRGPHRRGREQSKHTEFPGHRALILSG
jgi:hypothetical protein